MSPESVSALGGPSVKTTTKLEEYLWSVWKEFMSPVLSVPWLCVWLAAPDKVLSTSHLSKEYIGDLIGTGDLNVNYLCNNLRFYLKTRDTLIKFPPLPHHLVSFSCQIHMMWWTIQNSIFFWISQYSQADFFQCSKSIFEKRTFTYTGIWCAQILSAIGLNASLPPVLPSVLSWSQVSLYWFFLRETNNCTFSSSIPTFRHLFLIL